MKTIMHNYFVVFVSDFFEEVSDIFFVLIGSFRKLDLVCQVVDDPDEAFGSFVLKELVLLL
jgi:hypothetical protein